MMFTRCTLLVLLGLSVFKPLTAQVPTFGQRTYNGQATYTHADLNNDGREDLVFVTLQGFGVVLSNGDGTYGAETDYVVPNKVASGVAILDFNQDGKPDLVAYNSSASAFYEYLNNGDGTFHLQASYVTPGTVLDLVSGDFNHDGYPDIAFTTQSGSAAQLHIWFSNHAAGLSVGPTTSVPIGTQLTIGDFDGDGKADIFAKAYGFTSPNGYTTFTYIYFGDGTGHFPVIVNATTGHAADYLPMDIDGDGKTDLVGAAEAFNALTDQPVFFHQLFVLYGNSARSIHESSIPLSGYPVPATSNPIGKDTGADVGDFNGDGHPDIALLEAQSNGGSPDRLVILPGRGNRTFGSEEILYTSSQLGQGATVLRANRDSKPDIVTTVASGNGSAALFFLNDGSGYFGGCSLPNSSVGIHVCSPSTYTSTNAQFSLSAAGQPPMHKMEIWIDGVKRYEQFAHAFSHYAFLDKTLTVAKGTHHVTVYAVGTDNMLERKDYTITIQ